MRITLWAWHSAVDDSLLTHIVTNIAMTKIPFCTSWSYTKYIRASQKINHQRWNNSIILYLGVPFNIILLMAPRRIMILECWPEDFKIWHIIIPSVIKGIPSTNPKDWEWYHYKVVCNISLLLYRIAVQHLWTVQNLTLSISLDLSLSVTHYLTWNRKKYYCDIKEGRNINYLFDSGITSDLLLNSARAGQSRTEIAL